MQNVIPFPAPSAKILQGRFRPKDFVRSSVDFAEHDSCSGEDAVAMSELIESVADFYAHALMAGAQAIAAYDEFAEIMDARGEHAAAKLFRELAVAEAQDIGTLAPGTTGLRLAQLPRWQYHWLYQAQPDDVVQGMVFHLLTAHLALVIARDAEGRALAHYARMASAGGAAEVRAQSRELAAQKSRRLHRLAEALASHPAPLAWQADCNAQG